MTFTLGVDCHVLLSHPDIDTGDWYGFVCVLDNSIREGGVQINREMRSFDPDDPSPKYGTNVYIHFDVIMADNLRNPNGSARSQSRTADYAKLQEFLNKTDGINLITPIGEFLNYGAWGWLADERHTPKQSIVKCQVNNLGFYTPPIDPFYVEWSCWWDTSGDPGDPFLPEVLLTWNTSYWR